MKVIIFSFSRYKVCRKLDRELKEHPIENATIVNIDIDTDNNVDELMSKYNVYALPSITVLGDNDELFVHFCGFMSSQTLNNIIKVHLNS